MNYLKTYIHEFIQECEYVECIAHHLYECIASEIDAAKEREPGLKIQACDLNWENINKSFRWELSDAGVSELIQAINDALAAEGEQG